MSAITVVWTIEAVAEPWWALADGMKMLWSIVVHLGNDASVVQEVDA